MTRNLLAILTLAGGALLAQTPEGHWMGGVQTPGGELKMELDLGKDSSGAWKGALSIPAQGTKGLPLSEVTVKGSSVSFAIKAAGDPKFVGIFRDTQMKGDFQQGGGSMAFEFQRTGDAKFEKAVVNAPLSEGLEGSWEGPLEIAGTTLRLKFVLVNKAGAGTGTVISVDQGNVEIPIAAIKETGTKVTVDLPAVSGGFAGELKGNKLVGEWSQGGMTTALTLTKAAK